MISIVVSVRWSFFYFSFHFVVHSTFSNNLVSSALECSPSNAIVFHSMHINEWTFHKCNRKMGDRKVLEGMESEFQNLLKNVHM